ncbi:MAG: hypothetical protein KDE25_10865 [Novosphingobium sp.]|nr:hypothetical protein [Novosphingobium sp.]
MDNMRGHFPDHEDAHDAQDFDPTEDEVGRELPPVAIGQDERRMQVRAYNFWASLLGDRNFPSSDDFDPHGQTDFGPYSVLLNFTGDIENPTVAFLGDKLAQECGGTDVIERLSDVPSRSLLSRITDHYLQIIANQAPIGFEAEFVNQRGATILYRGILLPFSSDNQAIDYIYGVINWKELADQQTADELLLQIDQALDSKKLDDQEVIEMTDWADGPVDDSSPLELDAPLDDEVPEFPEPALSTGSRYASLHSVNGDRSPDSPSESSLADLLAAARDHADQAANCEKRTHEALYAAIGTAHDFALASRIEADDYRAMLEDAGLTVQDRAPMVPVVKLVFGTGYDKTRLAEYAALLDHANRLGLGRGALAPLLAGTQGGIKALVGEERRLRKAENGKPRGEARSEKLARKLRTMPARSIDDIPMSGAEFTLLVARRTSGGEIEILGEVHDQPALIEKAARHLAG